jgi:hypothetical protein
MCSSFLKFLWRWPLRRKIISLLWIVLCTSKLELLSLSSRLWCIKCKWVKVIDRLRSCNLADIVFLHYRVRVLQINLVLHQSQVDFWYLKRLNPINYLLIHLHWISHAWTQCFEVFPLSSSWFCSPLPKLTSLISNSSPKQLKIWMDITFYIIESLIFTTGSTLYACLVYLLLTWFYCY